MKVNKLKTQQLFLAGEMMVQFSEEFVKSSKGFEKNKDLKDVYVAMKYIASKFDEINKEIAGETLIRINEGMKKYRDRIEE